MSVPFDSTNSSGASSVVEADSNDFFTSISARWTVPNIITIGDNSNLISWIGLAQGTVGMDGPPHPLDPLGGAGGRVIPGIKADGSINADIMVQIGFGYVPIDKNHFVTLQCYCLIIPVDYHNNGSIGRYTRGNDPVRPNPPQGYTNWNPLNPDLPIVDYSIYPPFESDGYMNDGYIIDTDAIDADALFPVSPGDTIFASLGINNDLKSARVSIINETRGIFLQPPPFSLSLPGTINNMNPNPIQNFRPNWAGWMVGSPYITTPPSIDQYGAVIFDQIFAVLNSGKIALPSRTLSLMKSDEVALSVGQIEGPNVIACTYVP
jgi:hypothetical protein